MSSSFNEVSKNWQTQMFVQVSCARMCHHDAKRPRSRRISQTIAGLVSPVSARFALAAHHGSLSHLAFGNYAAADARRRRDSTLRALSRTISGRSRAGRRAPRRSVASMVRSRVLQPGAQPAKGRTTNRRETQRPVSNSDRGCPGLARHRKLHGCGDSEHCVR